MNADGSDQNALACGRPPAISRNRTKIVFMTHPFPYEIATMDANGSNRKAITNKRRRLRAHDLS